MRCWNRRWTIRKTMWKCSLSEILRSADPECKKRNKGFSAYAPGRSGFCLSSAKAAGKKSGRRSRDEAFVSHGTAFTACYAAYHDSGIFIVFSFLTFSDICMVVCIRKCLKYRSCYVSARVRKCEAYNLFKSGKGVRRCR